MSVIPKYPVEWLAFFRQQINEIFSFLATLESKEGIMEHEYIPLLDIFETNDRFVLEVDLPGFKHGDLAITLCCNVLVIEGTKRDETRSDVSYICLERRSGRSEARVKVEDDRDRAGVRLRPAGKSKCENRTKRQTTNDKLDCEP